MYQANFDLEIITPLFMSGSDGRTPELRPPSFKGMMRFWWRAMKAEDNINDLSHEESQLFGGTGEKEGKSNITLKFFNRMVQQSSFSPLPHKQTTFKIPAFKPTGVFKCQLRINTPDYVKKIISAFKISLLLGGFGKRSRRGFGSIAYKTFDKAESIVKEIDSFNSILSEDSENKRFGIEESNDKWIKLTRNINPNNPEYPRISDVYVAQKADSYENILIKIGKLTHKYRDNALGTIKPKRMASPIIATVVKSKKGCHAVITKLTSHFPYSTFNLETQTMFIKGVFHE